MPVPLKYPVLMPDTPPEIITELDNSPAMRRTKDELVTGARFQQEYAILRQQRIAEANSILEHRVMEGMGQKVAEIDQELYFQYMQLYGPECWADPAFVEDTLRKNPWMRIHTRFPARILIDGFRRSSKVEDSAPGEIESRGEPVTPQPRFGPLNNSGAPPSPHKIIPFAA